MIPGLHMLASADRNSLAMQMDGDNRHLVPVPGKKRTARSISGGPGSQKNGLRVRRLGKSRAKPLFPPHWKDTLTLSPGELSYYSPRGAEGLRKLRRLNNSNLNKSYSRSQRPPRAPAKRRSPYSMEKRIQRQLAYVEPSWTPSNYKRLGFRFEGKSYRYDTNLGRFVERVKRKTRLDPTSKFASLVAEANLITDPKKRRFKYAPPDAVGIESWRWHPQADLTPERKHYTGAYKSGRFRVNPAWWAAARAPPRSPTRKRKMPTNPFYKTPRLDYSRGSPSERIKARAAVEAFMLNGRYKFHGRGPRTRTGKRMTDKTARELISRVQEDRVQKSGAKVWAYNTKTGRWVQKLGPRSTPYIFIDGTEYTGKDAGKAFRSQLSWYTRSDQSKMWNSYKCMYHMKGCKKGVGKSKRHIIDTFGRIREGDSLHAQFKRGGLIKQKPFSEWKFATPDGVSPASRAKGKARLANDVLNLYSLTNRPEDWVKPSKKSPKPSPKKKKPLPPPRASNSARKGAAATRMQALMRRRLALGRARRIRLARKNKNKPKSKTKKSQPVGDWNGALPSGLPPSLRATRASTRASTGASTRATRASTRASTRKR